MPEIKSIYSFGGISVAKYVRDNLEHLQKDCYDRPVNSAIARGLLPLFLKHPELWNIVPFLGQIKEGDCLNDALGSITKCASLPPVVGDLLHHRFLVE